MPEYRHLFFDLDHTLWDFDRNSELTLRQLFEEFQLPSRGIADFNQFFAVYTTHNDRLWERFRNGYIRRDELRWKRLWLTFLDFKLADTELAKEMGSAYLEILPTQSHLMPHAKELLEYCRGNNYNMHLITNGFELTQWQKLRNAGIADYFDQVITSERSNSLKPHREIFEYALKSTGATVQESIMIGDALEIDILGASGAGWDQVYFNPSGRPHQGNPTYEIRSLDALMQLF